MQSASCPCCPLVKGVEIECGRVLLLSFQRRGMHEEFEKKRAGRASACMAPPSPWPPRCLLLEDAKVYDYHCHVACLFLLPLPFFMKGRTKSERQARVHPPQEEGEKEKVPAKSSPSAPSSLPGKFLPSLNSERRGRGEEEEERSPCPCLRLLGRHKAVCPVPRKMFLSPSPGM